MENTLKNLTYTKLLELSKTVSIKDRHNKILSTGYKQIEKQENVDEDKITNVDTKCLGCRQDSSKDIKELRSGQDSPKYSYKKLLQLSKKSIVADRLKETSFYTTKNPQNKLLIKKDDSDKDKKSHGQVKKTPTKSNKYSCKKTPEKNNVNVSSILEESKFDLEPIEAIEKIYKRFLV